MSDPPSQPMCARVLAGFLRSHFHVSLCTVPDEPVRVEVSFATLGVREEARGLVEHGGTFTRGGSRVAVAKVLQTTLDTLHQREGRFRTSVHTDRVCRARVPWKRGGGGASRPRPSAHKWMR